MPSLGVPQTLFFDWHGTLADTFVAMYRAVEEMLPQLGALGLEARLLPPGGARLPEHEALVAHVRARRISRTEIFEILFGADADAKHAAHEAFDRCCAPWRNWRSARVRRSGLSATAPPT